MFKNQPFDAHAWFQAKDKVIHVPYLSSVIAEPLQDRVSDTTASLDGSMLAADAMALDPR